MKNHDYFLFDADGTLIDTTELICQSFTYTCKTFGGLTIPREKIIHHIGLPLRKQMEVYFGPLSNEQFAKRAAAHMEYQLSIYKKHLRLFPTVLEGLTALYESGKHLAIVTSRRKETLDLYLQETGIYKYFSVFVTPESTQTHKPDPGPALEAMRLLFCSDPLKAVFIGDSEFDIECGSRANLDTTFVLWSENDPATFPTKPTYCISDLRQLCNTDC